MKKIIVALAAIVFMISCKSTQGTSQNITEEKINASELFIEGNQWELISYKGLTTEGAGFSLKQPILIINMAEQKVGGNSGCNSFGGEAIIESDTITIDKVFSTKMYCDGVPEHEFFQLLQQPLKYTVKGDVLHLEKDGVALLTYQLKPSVSE